MSFGATSAWIKKGYEERGEEMPSVTFSTEENLQTGGRIIGGLSGAKAGFAAGSALGPAGSVGGAIIGGVAGAISGHRNPASAVLGALNILKK